MDWLWLTKVRVAFRDVDMMGHVNNAVYLSYLETVRTDVWEHWFGHGGYRRMPYLVGEATVRYLAPAHIREDLSIGVRLVEVGRRTFVLEYLVRRESDGTDIARARTTLVFIDLQTHRSADVPKEFLEKAAELGVVPATGPAA